MERTIDGIDYIAKSEVLRIIDEELDECKTMAASSSITEIANYGWTCRIRALAYVRNLIANPEER